jgi:hypothetical protein
LEVVELAVILVPTPEQLEEILLLALLHPMVEVMELEAELAAQVVLVGVVVMLAAQVVLETLLLQLQRKVITEALQIAIVVQLDLLVGEAVALEQLEGTPRQQLEGMVVMVQLHPFQAHL